MDNSHFPELFDSGEELESVEAQQPVRKVVRTPREKIDIDKELICKFCGDKFTYRYLKKHTKTERHKLGRHQEKTKHVPKPHQEGTPQSAQVTATQKEPVVFVKEKYTLRFDVELSEQNQKYHNTLTAFLALRFALSSDINKLKISMNNIYWKEFGDIVLEITDASTSKIYAIQCKKIQSKNDISLSALTAEKGRFSLRQQCEFISHLKRRKNFDITYFKLFTGSNLIIDDNSRFIYDDNVIETWQNESNKNAWKLKELKIARYRKKCLVNTTDDPDNLCIFKILNEDDDILNRFSLYANQNNTETLKYQMQTMIENKFDIKRDISKEIVKYVGEYFQPNKIYKHNYIMTKRDILLKMAELIFQPFMLFPESTIEARPIEKWDKTIDIFDLIIIKNQNDIVNKIYSSINQVLKSNICSDVDTSIKSPTIQKDTVENAIIKSEMFDGFVGTTREVSLAYLYTILWKTQFAPLVLTVDNETNFSLIMKIIDFLKTEDVNVKFILMVDFKLQSNYFPEQLKIFTSLEDFKDIDDNFLKSILESINIPVLESVITLKDIIDLNPDFLGKVTPDTLLNMCLQEFSFKNLSVPISEDIIDNTLIFNDNMMDKFRNDLGRDDFLTYTVNLNGNPNEIRVPPDI